MDIFSPKWWCKYTHNTQIPIFYEKNFSIKWKLWQKTVIGHSLNSYLKPSFSQYDLQTKKKIKRKKKNPPASSLLSFSISPFLHFLLFPSFPDSDWNHSKVPQCKLQTVCSARHRQWRFVPVLRQKYFFAFFTIKIAAIIWIYSSGWQKKKKSMKGKRMKEFQPTAVWLADGTWVTIGCAIVSVAHRYIVISDFQLVGRHGCKGYIILMLCRLL